MTFFTISQQFSSGTWWQLCLSPFSQPHDSSPREPGGSSACNPSSQYHDSSLPEPGWQLFLATLLHNLTAVILGNLVAALLATLLRNLTTALLGNLVATFPSNPSSQYHDSSPRELGGSSACHPSSQPHGSSPGEPGGSFTWEPYWQFSWKVLLPLRSPLSLNRVHRKLYN